MISTTDRKEAQRVIIVSSALDEQLNKLNQLAASSAAPSTDLLSEKAFCQRNGLSRTFVRRLEQKAAAAGKSFRVELSDRRFLYSQSRFEAFFTDHK